jgi:hypothetical protein
LTSTALISVAVDDRGLPALKERESSDEDPHAKEPSDLEFLMASEYIGARTSIIVTQSILIRQHSLCEARYLKLTVGCRLPFLVW